MSKRLEIQKFTPLSEDKTKEIIDDVNPAMVAGIATKVGGVLAESDAYQGLVKGYQDAPDKREFLEKNMENIAAFLTECGLMGYEPEVVGENPGRLITTAYIIGAEATMLISAYLKHKEKNKGTPAHDVEVVKNTTFVSPSGSMKHADLSLEYGQVHGNLCETLKKDLAAAGDKEFNKTYVFEAFGTTGGNHFATLTIRKNPGETSPVVHLSDASPTMVKNGIEACQNSIAGGWCSQLIVNATVKKAFGELGLDFQEDKFFNNSEPVQSSGFLLCATFACETAHQIARMNSEEHRKELEGAYVHKSFYGGRTDMPMELNDEGYVISKPGLPATDVTMSHFVDTALRPRVEELASSFHTRKSGESESNLERIKRYQSEEAGHFLAQQKTMRQKYGHLFEIVTSLDFLSRATGAEAVTKSPEEELRKRDFSLPPYPTDGTPEGDICSVVEGIDLKLPISTRMNRVDYNAETETYKLVFYIGAMTGEKLAGFATENGLACESAEIDLAENSIGVSPLIRKVHRVTIDVPHARIDEVGAAIKSKEPFYIAQKDPSKHPFAPQGATALLEKDLSTTLV